MTITWTEHESAGCGVWIEKEVAMEHAPAGHYALDASHSSLLFRINHLALAWYTGRFTRLAADLAFDPERPEAMSLTASVALGSVRTEYQGTDKDWDRELAESADFLDAGRAPLATFASTSVSPRGDAQADVAGDLSFRGVTRPFIFDVTYNGSMLDHPVGKPLIGVSARGVLKRSEYGLIFGLGPRMPDDVQIILEAEFAKVD